VQQAAAGAATLDPSAPGRQAGGAGARRARLSGDRAADAKKGLYEAFAAKEAKRLCERLEFHPTPKHGSWLNMAETELSVLAGQCLDRRMESKEVVVSEVVPWEAERNRTEAKVRWRFTTEKARIKLEKLYPVLEYPEQPRA
jgi:hypothetical protein